MSRRKLFLHNDDFINAQAEEQARQLWDKINDRFEILEAKSLTQTVLSYPLTYELLTDFVAFHKNIDNDFCVAAIHKTQDPWMAQLDIEKCLKKRFWHIERKSAKYKNRKPIYYIDYQFDVAYQCPHGDEYKDVYLMFFTKNEKQTNQMLQKFNKLKLFI